jgi:hypothetical protein
MDNHCENAETPALTPISNHTDTSATVGNCPDHSELADVMSKKDLQGVFGNVQKFEKLKHGNWLPWKARILDMLDHCGAEKVAMGVSPLPDEKERERLGCTRPRWLHGHYEWP